MKKIWYILFCATTFLLLYAAWLSLYPLKKSVFYTNDERAEAYIYSKEVFPTVLAGSSLSGAFEKEKLFTEPYFNLYLPFTDCCTGVEIIRRCNKIPGRLFIEINHIDRGTDSVLINKLFNEPSYSLKLFFPFMLKKNKAIPNIVDRLKKPANTTINERKPPAELYKTLLANARKEWETAPDTVKFNKEFAHMCRSLQAFKAKGCQIYFYEMPMDSSLRQSPLLSYEREHVIAFVQKNGGYFIPADTSRSYNTGDGVHLLKDDAHVFSDYFTSKIKKMDNSSLGR